MVKRVCVICGKEFESRYARKYCSEECAMDAPTQKSVDNALEALDEVEE